MGRFSDSSSDQVGEYYQAQSWRQEGVKEERERIINLLEGELQPATDENELENYIINSLIALIKGENK